MTPARLYMLVSVVAIVLVAALLYPSISTALQGFSVGGWVK